MDNEIFEGIIDDYEKQLSKDKRERDARVEAVYSRVPEIREIDRDINTVGSDTLRAILQNPDKGELKEDMKNKFAVLKQRKKELLKKNGIPEDFDAMKYRCSVCKDTGYIEGKGRCACFRQKLIDRLYKLSNMSELLKKQNFDTFSMDYYSRNIPKGMKRSPYDNMINIKSYCENFVRGFDRSSKSMVFYGDTGLGKTFMSSCIAKALIDMGKTVFYVRATRLFRMFDDEKFGRLTDGMEDVYKSDLLIIDDLGTEAVYKNNNSYLLDLVNERMSNEKKMIINTNLNFENLENRYSKRFSSRILEGFDMLYFYGDDIRKQKLFGNN
ncbi:MAG: ATP-binding protein [Candidatus Ornithomonoglobus sp.]